MSHTITVRLPVALASWLEETAKRAGVPQDQVVRDQMEQAKRRAKDKPFMRLAGAVSGPRDLSMRQGFSPK